MFARLVRFSFDPGDETKIQELAGELGPLIAVQPGCEAVTVFGNYGDGECGIYVMWDSQENANSAAEVVRPKLDEHLAGIAKGPPDTRLFEVIWSK